MINVGIFCKDTEQVEDVAECIYDYTHQRPILQMKGMTTFCFPLLTIDIITISQARGHRFHLTFYEKDISEEEMWKITICSPYARPRPLEDILWEVKK